MVSWSMVEVAGSSPQEEWSSVGVSFFTTTTGSAFILIGLTPRETFITNYTKKEDTDEQAFGGGVGLGTGPFKTAGTPAGVTLFQLAGVDFLPTSLPINWLKGVGLASVKVFNVLKKDWKYIVELYERTLLIIFAKHGKVRSGLSLVRCRCSYPTRT